MANQLNVTELDFDAIKANLKSYLTSQSEFSDYNFEGSGLSILIELLAYNTHYNGMLAHALANENFIDTAVKRESVVSIAKALGYVPRSRRGAVAKVNFSIEPSSSYTSTSLEISRNVIFTSTIDGTTLKFYPTESTTVNATTAGGTGPYYLYGTSVSPSSGTKGYYYPLYLTEEAATAANSLGTGSTTYTFTEYSGTSFYMPKDNINAGIETLGTTSQTNTGVVVDTGLAYGRYTGQLPTSSKVTQFNFNSLSLKEGIRVDNKFIVEAATPQGPFVIPNESIDSGTLRVRVQDSASNLTIITYSKADKFLDIKSDTKCYFVEEGPDGLYQLRFGDDVLGKKLTPGNIVIVDYINCNGRAGNNANSFTTGVTISGAGEKIKIDLAQAGTGGDLKESVDEIRYNAPKFNATRDRAVTSADYESLILDANPNIQSCSVWGGEKNDPPIYGKVFISLNPAVGSIVTEADKDNIKTSIIDPKTPVAIIPEFVDPEFTYIGLDINCSYDPKLTTLSKGEVESQVKTAVTAYFNNDLNKLNKSFYNTKLHDRIKERDEAIITIGITTKLQKRIKPTLAAAHNYSIQFNQQLQPRELSSTYFNMTSGGVDSKVTLVDVPAASVIPPLYSGTGTVNAVKSDGTIIAAVGTIDYDAGTITIPSMTVASLYGTELNLRVNAVTRRDVRDITTQALVRTSDTSTAAVVAKPSRNMVLTLDDSILNSTINTKTGLIISAIPEVEEI